jgi:iron complex outermembrane receptor protein
MTRKGTKLHRSSAIAFAVGAVLAGAAPERVHAADQPTAKTQTGLDEIVVTARKRVENLQEVPIAVSAFSDETLDARQVFDLAGLNGQVPNLTVYAARGSNTTLTAFIRGIGQADPLWGVDPGVGLYLDDVYIARPQGALLDVFDVARVEILRGPQGTLYGKNTIGGAIKYVGAEQLPEFKARVEGSVGNYGRRNAKGMLNVPLGETASLRVAGALLQRDGYGDNLNTGAEVSDQDTTAARAALRWQPTDALDVRLAADLARDDSTVRGAKRLAPNPLQASIYRQPLTPANESPYDVNNGMVPVNYTDTNGYSLTIGWDLGGAWALKSITAYREGETLTSIDFDTLPLAIADVGATYKDHQTSQELQLLYSGDRFSGVGGFFWFDGKAGGQVRNTFLGGTPLVSYGDTQGDVTTESWAGFGEGTWKATDRMNLTVGLRYTSEKKGARVLNRAYADGTFTRPIATVSDFDKSKTFTSFSPKLSLDYQLTDATMAYASASRGFKSGGYNVRANSVAVPSSAEPFEDEVATTFEIGAKNTFADGRVQFNAAYFYTDYEDVQLSVFTSFTQPNGTQGFFGDFTNAGAATVQGVELEMTARPVPAWTLQANASYLNAKYDEFISRGVNIADTQRFTNAPKWQGGLNSTYSFDLGNAGLLAWQLGATYQSEVWPTTDLSPAIREGGYGLVNSSLNWTSADETWRASLWGKNLGDKVYRTTGYNIPALGILTGFYGPPREYGVTVSYSF